jgi:DNA-binding NtrC family response regulator
MPGTVETADNRLECILVVDDDVLVRMVIAGYLRECGFKVIEAVDADEAMIVLDQAEVHVDVVFSDVEMPGVDGFALTKWIRAHRPEIAVILAGTPARAMDAAADLCKSGPDLAKPYEPQLVLERIRRLLADRERKRKTVTGASIVPSIPPTAAPERPPAA